MVLDLSEYHEDEVGAVTTFCSIQDLTTIFDVREAALVEEIDVDATVFLQFLKMSRNIFLSLTVVGCDMLIPVALTS